jgi:hypothetical protein
MNRYEKTGGKDEGMDLLNDIEGTASDRKLSGGKRFKKAAASGGLKILSGVAGGFAGAAFGRASLLVGILATGAGEMMGSGELTSFGVGMMASNVVPSDSSLNGTEDEKKTAMQKAKDRVKSYGKGIMQKLWIDKLVKKEAQNTTTQTKSAETTSNTSTATTTDQATSGIGEVKYYSHPQSAPDPMDLAELERIEKQVNESGENFAKENGSNITPAISGRGDDDAFLGSVDDERIY